MIRDHFRAVRARWGRLAATCCHEGGRERPPLVDSAAMAWHWDRISDLQRLVATIAGVAPGAAAAASRAAGARAGVARAARAEGAGAGAARRGARPAAARRGGTTPGRAPRAAAGPSRARESSTLSITASTARANLALA